MATMMLELYWGVPLELSLVQKKELERSRMGQGKKLGQCCSLQKGLCQLQEGL